MGLALLSLGLWYDSSDQCPGLEFLMIFNLLLKPPGSVSLPTFPSGHAPPPATLPQGVTNPQAEHDPEPLVAGASPYREVVESAVVLSETGNPDFFPRNLTGFKTSAGLVNFGCVSQMSVCTHTSPGEGGWPALSDTLNSNLLHRQSLRWGPGQTSSKGVAQGRTGPMRRAPSFPHDSRARRPWKSSNCQVERALSCLAAAQD